jgi:type IV pilus assembly protein PilB
VDAPPKKLQNAILSRVKILSGMDIAEKRRPQDGRIGISVGGKKLDIRVSTLPAYYGESLVMRLLEKESILINLQELGFHESDYKRFQSIIRRPNGIFLVTGPTGSGKTTTLYAALNELNRPDKKIITAEDPVEYHLSGVNQCEMKRQTGMTFQRILRAMLRQAPDIILVGEIRDPETAEIAVQAALTGHLVFSTLHTNDAPGAITRLIDMGIKPFLVSSGIQACMAQRLVRTICPQCKTPTEYSQKELAAIGLKPEDVRSITLYKGAGCSFCRNTGFRGRTGVFELMEMDAQLREMTFRREPHSDLRKQARMAGMVTLREDGVRKILAGVTTIEEVLEESSAEVEEEMLEAPV